MIEYFLKKFLPFTLARTISLAGIPVLQFVILHYSSETEAGEFYLLTSVAFIFSQIADLGLSRAAPVLFGDSLENTDERLPEIIFIRWVLGIFFGCYFIFFSSFGDIHWVRATTGIMVMMFCFGRVILLGNQGYRHARQEFFRLFIGGISNIVALVCYYAIASKYMPFNTQIAMSGLTVGIWVEIIVLDCHFAHPFSKINSQWKSAVRYIFPFASVGVVTAIYNRIEALVAGYYLSPSVLGIFGALDQAFKLAIWPSYMSAQAIFPEINSALETKNGYRLRTAIKKHFAIGTSICLIVMLVFIVCLNYKFLIKENITVAAIILLLAVWMAIPGSLIDTFFFSLRLQKKYAILKLGLTLLRFICAILLAIKLGFVGICATHSIMTALALIIFSVYLFKEKKTLTGMKD